LGKNKNGSSQINRGGIWKKERGKQKKPNQIRGEPCGLGRVILKGSRVQGKAISILKRPDNKQIRRKQAGGT